MSLGFPFTLKITLFNKILQFNSYDSDLNDSYFPNRLWLGNLQFGYFGVPTSCTPEYLSLSTLHMVICMEVGVCMGVCRCRCVGVCVCGVCVGVGVCGVCVWGGVCVGVCVCVCVVYLYLFKELPPVVSSVKMKKANRKDGRERVVLCREPATANENRLNQ